MRIMALDVGTVRIGIATTDILGLTAQGKENYTRKSLKQDIEYICNFINENEVGEIVIGLPLNMDGSFGEQATYTQNFKNELSKETSLPISFVDERLTSKQATSVLILGDVSRKRRKNHTDMLSAVLILQNYMAIKG